MFEFLNQVEIEPTPDHRWLELVMKLNHKSSLMIGNLLLMQSFRYQRRKFISLSPRLLDNFQIHRATAFRGVNHLEAAGLVTVRRKRGVAPSVSIIDVDPVNSGQQTNGCNSEAEDLSEPEEGAGGDTIVSPPENWETTR